MIHFVDLGSGTWGGLRSKQVKTLKAADFQQTQKVAKVDDFNDFHVKCVGKHCTIQMNGLITVDDDFPAIPDEGQIGLILLGHGEAAFRNLFVKELNAGK